MAHRVEHEEIEAEKYLIKVLQLELMAELERKLRTLTEGNRLAELLASTSAERSTNTQRAAVAELTRLVDQMLTANARVRGTLLWLRENVAGLSNDLSPEDSVT